MARIRIEAPQQIVYDTLLDVRIGDINYANHLSNDALLRMAQEVRLRLLRHWGHADELHIGDVGFVVADAAISYLSEAFHGDVLRFLVGIADIHGKGLDFIYQVIDDNSGREVARLKTGIVFFDYQARQVAPMPESFSAKLGQ
ncbi:MULTISPECIES: acyl-CoA thioesterase [Chromobacteriaceae]|uniref:Thioesterase family protein n=2 Tax=Chromobacteriaceae TaxID=1499392 RepID=A0ABV0FKX0_9NEIS|nr:MULTISPECIES: thioesterase family protein [Chromobacteriaceae]AVG17343.1 thioesterase [Chromobacterium vaccinii]ERE13984.1 thioesterase [Pseudogulbenkiania ferrooxidans EGD-HP2]MCD4502231.1 thioesterase family protein [Chromobacterium vaccinii]